MSQLTDIQSGAVATGAVAPGAIAPRVEVRRVYFLAGWMALTLGLFWAPLRSVIAYASENDDASHIFIIPILATGVLYLDRERVFRRVGFCGLAGGGLATPGGAS